jgi:hypothetical protein
MKFKVGDKVKFLNQRGGGVVSRIIGSNLVYVTIEDGFEIPTISSELIRMEENLRPDAPEHMFSQEFNVSLDNVPQAEPVEEDRTSPLTGFTARGTLPDGIYLGFVPHDQKWLITGLLDVFLINHTDYHILFNLFLELPEGGFKGADYGSLSPESKYLLDTIDRESVGFWSKGIVQVLFHKDQDDKVMIPGNADFRVKAAKFSQEGSYRDSSFLEQKAILLTLLHTAGLTSIARSEMVNKPGENEACLVKAQEAVPEVTIDKHRTGPREAVVDLHIGELVDDYSRLTNGEIFEIQKNYFVSCLESALANHYTKITFIHGVGAGSLKTTILKTLGDYDGVEARDASQAKFGYGATEVLIRHNR